ncbi:MAG: hypothetical protein ACC628_12715 [Pirellulaceae bacterium]
MMHRSWSLWISLVVSVCAAGVRAEERSVTFDDPELPDNMSIEGAATIDTANHRPGGAGGALRVAPEAQVVWKLRDTNGSGQVEFWILDDGRAPTDPKKHGAGPRWGLIQEDGRTQTVGAVYAPYLSGDKTYAASDFDPTEDERPWWQVQYLGLRRDASWHKWTFVFDAHDGLHILYDDQDLNARRPVFNWNKTRLLGFTGVVLWGDRTDARQTLLVDDIRVELGPAGETQPLWPPPPPASLTTVPPPTSQTATPYAAWQHGPSDDPNYFPIAVWLQDPKHAERYLAAGINLYIGLWKGPTEEQLSTLKQAGMRVICSQNEVGKRHVDDETIVAWMHGDEPDNAQSLGAGKGYGPPILPKKIIEDYQRIAAVDPSRPVILNLGQGVAWDGWRGRGVRTNHPEDYPEYAKGCDIVSFDIYPAVHRHDEIRSNLWYVAHGVSRLRSWSNDEKIVWNCIECTRISNPNVKPTPHQVRAEVWMSIIHGSRGLIYFVHQFKPDFIEAGLFADEQMLAAVTKLNRQVHSLAQVINSPTLVDVARVTSTAPHTPVHLMAKRLDGATYLFAVALYHEETEATFQVTGLETGATVEVIDESRDISMTNGKFTDHFRGYDVHLYKIK